MRSHQGNKSFGIPILTHICQHISGLKKQNRILICHKFDSNGRMSSLGMKVTITFVGTNDGVSGPPESIRCRSIAKPKEVPHQSKMKMLFVINTEKCTRFYFRRFLRLFLKCTFVPKRAFRKQHAWMDGLEVWVRRKMKRRLAHADPSRLEHTKIMAISDRDSELLHMQQQQCSQPNKFG